MNKKRIFLAMLLIAGLTPYSASQTDEEQLSELERIIENQERSADMNIVDEELSLNLSVLLDINKVSAMDLLSLKGITPLYAKAIVKHRLEFGAFMSLLELQTIDEIPGELTSLLRTYLSIEPINFDKTHLLSALKMSKKDLIAKLSTSRPYAIGYVPYGVDSMVKYLGSPQNYQLRFRANADNKILYGFSAEKDKGEEFFKTTNPQGFDFYSFHFYLANKGWLKKLVIGDYQTCFGQGLTISNDLGIGKSASVLNVKQNAMGIRPYRSMNEQDFYRGAGIAFGKNKFESTFFVSKLRIDANTDSLMLAGEINFTITSFANTGLHRTILEKSKKNTVSKFVVGQDVNYKTKNIHLGLVGVYQSFDRPLLEKDKIYNRYYFSGQSFFKGGFYINFWHRNINFFSEAAFGHQKSNAYIAGLFISLANDFDLVLVNRRFSKTYIGDNSKAFSENSAINNEHGTYLGCVYKLSKSINFSFYVDRYILPWYSYYVDGRGKGVDFLAELHYKPNKTTLMYARFRTKSELQNSPSIGYNALNFVEKDNFRLHAETKVTPTLTFKCRFEYSRHERDKVMTNGNISYLDFIYRPERAKIKFISRICVFNTQGYHVRIYALENDVLYSWAVTGFSGSGTKLYGIVNYKINTLAFQMRYAYTKYYDRVSIGNAFDAVNSNYLHEINLLIRYGFD